MWWGQFFIRCGVGFGFLYINLKAAQREPICAAGRNSFFSRYFLYRYPFILWCNKKYKSCQISMFAVVNTTVHLKLRLFSIRFDGIEALKNNVYIISSWYRHTVLWLFQNTICYTTKPIVFKIALSAGYHWCVIFHLSNTRVCIRG